MKKRILAVITVLCLLCGLAGCVDPVPEPGNSEPKPSAPDTTYPAPTDPAPTEPEPTEPSVVLPLTFSNMPDMYSELANVYLSGNVAVFAFVTSGMNDPFTTLVTYDLSADTLLGQLELGEDTVSLFPYNDGEFAVLSHSRKTFAVYDASCNQLSLTTIDAAESDIGIAGYNGSLLLLSQLATGEVELYNLADGTSVKTDLAPGAYQYIGAYGNGFLLGSYDDGLVNVSADGSTQILFGVSSAQVVGSAYAAGVRGDYVIMQPLFGGDPVMAPAIGEGEFFCAAEGTGLLSHSQTADFSDTLYYYATDTMMVRSAPAGGQVLAAALKDGCAVAVVRTDFSEPLKYTYVDFSAYGAETIGSSAYDGNLLNGIQPMPEPVGSSETVALIRRLEQEYGVRVMYESGVFDLEPLGFTVVPTTEDKAYEKALLLEELLRFLPQGLLKEMGQTSPVVIYLCEDLQPTAGGMNTILNGYNVVFLSVTGTDDYFLSVAAHETAHAIERGIDGSVVAGWREMMPDDVRAAYDDLSLTVEYTPDDKGNTPVWFLDVYSRTAETEDRAVIFSALFDAWRSGDTSDFAYDGIRQKAAYWAAMLRTTYSCCGEDTVFAWEALLEE